MRLLFVGDIVGKQGVNIVCQAIPGFRRREGIDLVVVNGVEAIDSSDNSIEIISSKGRIVANLSGNKAEVAELVVATIQNCLMIAVKK